MVQNQLSFIVYVYVYFSNDVARAKFSQNLFLTVKKKKKKEGEISKCSKRLNKKSYDDVKCHLLIQERASLVAQLVENPPAMQKTWV